MLLPAFHCTALVEPVIAYGAKVRYYTVNQDLTLELDEIESFVRSGSAAILFVHFFGFPAPIKQLQEMADTYGIRLIEIISFEILMELSSKSFLKGICFSIHSNQTTNIL